MAWLDEVRQIPMEGAQAGIESYLHPQGKAQYRQARRPPEALHVDLRAGPRCSTHRSDSPIGTADPSPPFQRWVQSSETTPSPRGAKEDRRGVRNTLCSCRDSFGFRSPIPHR